jgi:uncharacterized protein (UPF0261 family)
LIPLGGWSSVDKRGSHFYDRDLDTAFVQELRKKLRPEIEFREIDADLDTSEFAHEVVKDFCEMMETRGPRV